MDACALIASIAGEDGAENVHKILNKALDGEIEIVMNKINLLEVYYDVYKHTDKKKPINF
jgi:predicted nucleic acid-binding protein